MRYRIVSKKPQSGHIVGGWMCPPFFTAKLDIFSQNNPIRYKVKWLDINKVEEFMLLTIKSAFTWREWIGREHNGAKDPPVCPQLENNTVIGEEDCLVLNIFTPSSAVGQLPVMVYVHGGGFVMGSGSEYGGDLLVEKDVILVTLNYRYVYGIRLKCEPSQDHAFFSKLVGRILYMHICYH